MEQVLTYQGETYQFMPSKRAYLYRAGFKGTQILLEDSIGDMVNQIYGEGLELARPELHYRTLPISQVSAELIPQLYAHHQQITFWVSTLGVQMDEAIQRYIKGEKVLHATLLDAWASEALEELNQSFHDYLRETYGVGKRRFSPGFGDLRLEVNHQIVQMLAPTKVTANPETGVLRPSKSTVCLIGWSEGDESLGGEREEYK